MFGIAFIKAPPTTYVLHFKDGKVVREGPGLSFFYYSPTSTIVNVPLGTVDVPFVFNEVTADFQNVSIQGQLTYRVADPKQLAAMLDFSVRPSGTYVSDDPKKLDERLVNLTQVMASAVTHRMTLREALVAYDVLVAEVLTGLRASQSVQRLGVEIMELSITAIKPTPETAKALEAEARELILRQADEAIYTRRNSAVEQERRIKESELNTEIAVEEKRRQIRETKMSADIAVESQRSGLIERQVENERRVADTRVRAGGDAAAAPRDGLADAHGRQQWEARREDVDRDGVPRPGRERAEDRAAQHLARPARHAPGPRRRRRLAGIAAGPGT